jgi:hypothetical protein
MPLKHAEINAIGVLLLSGRETGKNFALARDLKKGLGVNYQ